MTAWRLAPPAPRRLRHQAPEAAAVGALGDEEALLLHDAVRAYIEDRADAYLDGGALRHVAYVGPRESVEHRLAVNGAGRGSGVDGRGAEPALGLAGLAAVAVCACLAAFVAAWAYRRRRAAATAADEGSAEAAGAFPRATAPAVDSRCQLPLVLE